jgi:hypothetical protein
LHLRREREARLHNRSSRDALLRQS